MNLYIGGRSQGKLEYCKSLHEKEDCVILDGAFLSADAAAGLTGNASGTASTDASENVSDSSAGTIIFNRLHLWVRTCLQENKDPQEVFFAFANAVSEKQTGKPSDECVCGTSDQEICLEVISDEIGNGIVPNDPFEREWREATGRLLREIAMRSDRVVRIVCGMPQVIKDAPRSAKTAGERCETAPGSQGELSPLAPESQREQSTLAQLYMIRHGAVKGNLEKRFIGITDESLTEEGAETIRAKVKEETYPPEEAIDLLFSSPLRRCLETAAIVYPGKEAVMVPDWSEILFGEFEYGNYIELSGDPRYQAWIDSGGEAAFPGGESKAEYCERVVRGFREVCKCIREYAADQYKTDQCAADLYAVNQNTAARKKQAAGVTAAASVHLGTMKALLSALTDAGYFDVQASNGGGYLLTIDPVKEKIVRAEPF
ncbi:MAG: hypothetical protein E7240_05795 [Lachnospiraceae bacterium]|nr:hypothetical protein [Lachnospiraceae bacterium]